MPSLPPARIPLDRRAVLRSFAAVALTAAVPVRAASSAPAPASAVAQKSFAAASAALTGYPSSDAGDVAKMYAAFATPDRRAALAKLARVVADAPAADLDRTLAAQGLATLADDLVSAWYSGIVGKGASQRLVLYADAYVWAAMTFSKPMGVCGGVTGYWADPPQ